MTTNIGSLKFTLLNKPLFQRKLALIVVAMAMLVPLVMMKTRVPAMVYVGALLVIHIWVFFLYLYRVQWREFTKVGIASRLASVVVFSYLLSKIHYAGGVEVLLSVVAAFGLHVIILLVLMVKVERPHREGLGA